jgi:RHS repeat-associated protein
VVSRSGNRASAGSRHNGPALLGTDTSSPYSVTWSNVAQGNYAITAKVTTIKKNQPDQVATSSPRNIIVTLKPTATLLTPVDGTTVSGPTFTVSGSASDPDGTVAKMSFCYEDFSILESECVEDTTSPYSVTITIAHPVCCNSDTIPYHITAGAVDNQGAGGGGPNTHAVVEVPVVGLANPLPNATYTAPATIALQADAVITGNPARVEFYNGSSLIATDTSAPYTATWSNVAAGTYTLTAKAVYGSFTATSPGVNITVNAGVAKLHFIEVDHLNTPRLVEDDQKRAVWRWDQDEPFGANVPNENPSGLGIFNLPLRFPGQYFDSETGLHYNYYRSYDPAIGRYAESDPIGLEGGINTYLYVSGSPLLYTDPHGLWRIGDPLPQGVVNLSAGLGSGILSTMSLGLVSGKSLSNLRSSLGVYGGVDECTPEYSGGVLAGTALALGTYAFRAIPATLTHFTTRAGAAGIARAGSVTPGPGLFGRGVYAATIGRPLNLFVPAASTIPIQMSGTAFMRIIPYFVYLQGGSPVTIGWAAGLAFFANRNNMITAENCPCRD